MKQRPFVAVVLLGMLAFAAPVIANQEKGPKPNFSGTWHLAAAPNDTGQVQRIEHTETELILRHASEGGGHRIVYVLDGKPQKTSLGLNSLSTTTASQTPTGVRIESDAWYGGPSNRRINTVQVWTLNAKGQLEIQMTRTENGETKKELVVYEKR